METRLKKCDTPSITSVTYYVFPDRMLPTGATKNFNFFLDLKQKILTSKYLLLHQSGKMKKFKL